MKLVYNTWEIVMEQETPVSRGTEVNTVAIKALDEFGKAGRHTHKPATLQLFSVLFV